MFDIVAPHNDELALAVEVIDIDDVQPARAIAASGRTEAASEQQTENIKQQHRSDEERNERCERWQQLSEFIGHERLVSRSNAREPCQINSFHGKRRKKVNEWLMFAESASFRRPALLLLAFTAIVLDDSVSVGRVIIGAPASAWPSRSAIYDAGG
ncbi:MAG: hypothetical protein WC689_09905 [Methylocystis sp.]|jgi:hypothetical protein